MSCAWEEIRWKGGSGQSGRGWWILLVEAQDAFAFAVVVKAVAGFDFEVGFVFAKGSELDFAVFFDFEGCLFAFLGAAEFGFEVL